MNIDLYQEVIFTYLYTRLPILVILSLAVLGMEWARSRFYQGRFYKPFLLNVILAWIPLILSIAAYVIFLQNDFQENLASISLLVVWFFFFPNSIYLITEVHHFRDRFADDGKDPFWYDNIEILSIVSLGLLLGTHSLAVVDFLLKSYLPNNWSWLILIGYVFLANLGIYIGRYLRLNSWDIISNPVRLLKQVFNELNSRSKLQTLMVYTALFSFFVLIFYRFTELTIDNLYTLALDIERLQKQVKS